MKKPIIIIIAATLAILYTGCENNYLNGLEDINDALTIAEDEVFAIKSAEATDCDVNAARFSGHLFQGSMMISGPHLFFGRNFPDCASVSVEAAEDGGFPKTITIDYGEACMGKAGMKKSGVITIVMSDTIINEGAVYTLTFEDVSIGNREVEKTATITNSGPNNEGNWVISSVFVMTSTMVSEGATMVMVRDYAEQKEWLSGFLSPETEDDIFLKTGEGTLIVNDDLKFERNIIIPLLINRNCLFPISGVIEITKDDEMMTINYWAGEGEAKCDNIALVTKDGEEEEIELLSARFRKGFQRHNRDMRQKKGWW